ncbi:MAG: GNAT family N-acetyltransferase [Candidatus Krumholzibacteriia bacterium]
MAPGDAAAVARAAVTVEPAPPAGWDALLAADPDATFFHTPLWSDALRRHAGGVTPLWFVAREGGRCLGGLSAVTRRRGPLRLLQSHFDGTAGGPLIAPDLPEPARDAVAAALLERWARAARRPDVAAASLILAPAADARWGGGLARLGWRRRDLPFAAIPLAGGPAAVEYGVLPKNRRNERNRALRRGCTAGVTTDPGVLAEYYPIYLTAARRWGVAPTPEALLRELLVRGDGAAFLSWVRRDGRLVGGHVCFRHGAEVVAWNGATLPEHAEVFPATLLVWTDVVEACRGGAQRLDLGGSGGIAGVARFKELLGARFAVRGCWETAAPLYRIWRRLRAGGKRASDAAAGGGADAAGRGGGTA